MIVKIKQFIRKIGVGKIIESLVRKILLTFHLNNKYILFTSKKAEKNKVNLNYCHDFKNVGDNISPRIIEFVAKKYNIDLNKYVSNTKHLYAVGSIITAGAQDCTVWGSGLLNTSILNRLNKRSLDIRAVRGPLTRVILIDRGFSVPEIYGDPAILTPLFYNPSVEKKYKVSLVTHMNENKEKLPENVHQINIVTDDYKAFIDEIKASELLISSSLHGIIFAESYGVPAVMLKPNKDLFKYFDYYYSTGRYTFPIADTIQEALSTKPLDIPDFANLQNKLLDAFPADLWEN